LKGFPEIALFVMDWVNTDLFFIFFFIASVRVDPEAAEVLFPRKKACHKDCHFCVPLAFLRGKIMLRAG
jgi:hypothetical protein